MQKILPVLLTGQTLLTGLLAAPLRQGAAAERRS